MHYQSTRGSETSYTFFDTVRTGIAPDGGLFVPAEVPRLSSADLDAWRRLSLPERAARIMHLFAPELTESLCDEICARAFAMPPGEEGEETVCYEAKQLSRYLTDPLLLFLDRGATAHYTDLTQRFSIACLEALPSLDEHFLVVAGATIEEAKALAAIVPEGGRWSPWLICDSKGVQEQDLASLQYLFEQNAYGQMTSIPSVPSETSDLSAGLNEQSELAEGLENLSELSGNLPELSETDEPSPGMMPIADSARLTLLKGRVTEVEWSMYDLLNDRELRERLAEEQINLAVAGSLSFSHQLALVIVLISAYLDLLGQEALAADEKITLAVPAMSLDFVYAGQLLKRMGLPLERIYCASNRNKITADFFRSGRYRLQRKFFRTNSPQLDRLVCENLERVLFELTKGDTAEVAHQMDLLVREDQLELTLDGSTKQNLDPLIAAGYADIQMTTRAIRDWYDRTDYLFDPYTAISLNVWERQGKSSDCEGKCLAVACESPLLSAAACSESIFGKGYHRGRSEEVLLEELAAESGLPVPPVLGTGEQELQQRLVSVEDLKAELMRDVCGN